MSLFQGKMLRGWEKFVTKDILETSNDDRTYLHILWLNGYYNKGCTKWTVHELIKESDMNLEGSLSGKNKNFISGGVYDVVAQRVFYQPQNRTILNSFGLWT